MAIIREPWPWPGIDPFYNRPAVAWPGLTAGRALQPDPEERPDGPPTKPYPAPGTVFPDQDFG